MHLVGKCVAHHIKIELILHILELLAFVLCYNCTKSKNTFSIARNVIMIGLLSSVETSGDISTFVLSMTRKLVNAYFERISE